jgi:hypothetical protein
MPPAALLVIEESSSSVEDMQKNMAVVDECGRPGTVICINLFHLTLISSSISPSASTKDECARAADIYDCGKKNAPVMVNSIQKSIQKSLAVSDPGGVMSKCFCFFCFQLFWFLPNRRETQCRY